MENQEKEIQTSDNQEMEVQTMDNQDMETRQRSGKMKSKPRRIKQLGCSKVS